MKHLKITKEKFEKSRYFTKKYGKLEYVSESGKLFKTNKGNILKFNESKMVNEGLFSDIGNDIGYRIDNGIKGLKKVFRGKPKFKVGDELEWKYPKGDEWYPFVVKDVQWIDGQWRYGDENAETYHPHGFWSRDYWHPQSWCRPKQGTYESTKKFGKKFNESNDQEEFSYKGVVISRYDYESLPDPMAASKLDDKTMQKIAEDIYDLLVSNGWDDKTINLYLGRNLDEIEDEDNRDANMIKDDFWRFMEQAAIENGMQYYEDMSEEGEMNESKKLGKKFSKESASDIASDPAYECPYCGSHDCELDDAEDIGSGLTDGYFDGATFNAQFWCNECNKPYNVTFEMKVKDVYPNEDAAMFGDD